MTQEIKLLISVKQSDKKCVFRRFAIICQGSEDLLFIPSLVHSYHNDENDCHQRLVIC